MIKGALYTYTESGVDDGDTLSGNGGGKSSNGSNDGELHGDYGEGLKCVFKGMRGG